MKFENFITENGAKYRVQNEVLDFLGNVEHYSGVVIIQNQEIKAIWDSTGKCIKLGDTNPTWGTHEPASYSLIEVTDFEKNSLNKGVKTRTDVGFRIYKQIRNVPGDIIRYDGEVNIGGRWLISSWLPDGKSMHGVSNRVDYDLILSKEIIN